MPVKTGAMSHTPGPWKFNEGVSETKDGEVWSRFLTVWNSDETRRPQDGHLVAEISVRVKPERNAYAEYEVALANAELIASAPLLEERVQALMETLQTIADFAVGNGDVCEIIAKRARAALAEAERVLEEKP